MLLWLAQVIAITHRTASALASCRSDRQQRPAALQLSKVTAFGRELTAPSTDPDAGADAGALPAGTAEEWDLLAAPDSALADGDSVIVDEALLGALRCARDHAITGRPCSLLARATGATLASITGHSVAFPAAARVRCVGGRLWGERAALLSLSVAFGAACSSKRESTVALTAAEWAACFDADGRIADPTAVRIRCLRLRLRPVQSAVRSGRWTSHACRCARGCSTRVACARSARKCATRPVPFPGCAQRRLPAASLCPLK